MKKIIALILMVIMLCVILCGCDNNNIDIEISRYKYYVDTSDTYKIYSYNGYICTKYNTVKNEDGSYTVTLIFDQTHDDRGI